MGAFVFFWLATLVIPAGLALAAPRRVWWVVALGGVIALGWWSLFWFGSTESEDGTWSRAESVAFGAIALGVMLCIWTGAAWSGRVARHIWSRRAPRRTAPP